MIEAATKRRISPEKNREYRLRAQERHPEKVKARWKTRDAIKQGKLVRQLCEVCGNTKSEAHHDDYSKPLDVRWLCKKHHTEVHRGPRRKFSISVRPTHCKRGHPLTPDNVLHCSDGGNRCRTCLNWRVRMRDHYGLSAAEGELIHPLQDHQGPRK